MPPCKRNQENTPIRPKDSPGSIIQVNLPELADMNPHTKDVPELVEMIPQTKDVPDLVDMNPQMKDVH